MRPATLLITALLISQPLSPSSSQSTEPTSTLDSLDIQQVERELVALRDGNAATRIRLRDREKILWRGAKGIVGVVLTDQRFLAVSTSSSGWREFRLQRSETPNASVQLGANVGMLLTRFRILTFDGVSGSLRENRLGPNEALLASGINEHVAIVVTNRRAIGLASRFGQSLEIPLRIQEVYESSKTLGTTATVRTSHRLLVFRASSGTWAQEERLLR